MLVVVLIGFFLFIFPIFLLISQMVMVAMMWETKTDFGYSQKNN
jgi:hypothetical protein